jgi:hypothetical protein
MRYLIRIVFTIQRAGVVLRGWSAMGAVIMLGTLSGLVILIFGLVLRFDPEVRRSHGQERVR